MYSAKAKKPNSEAKKSSMRQTSIVNFLDKESQQKFMDKYSTPTKNQLNSNVLSPINNNVIYPSPIVDLNAVNKDKEFYSLDEFKIDMNTTAFKKALFNAEKKFERTLTAEEKFDALQEDKKMNKKKYNPCRYFNNDTDSDTGSYKSYNMDFDSDDVMSSDDNRVIPLENSEEKVLNEQSHIGITPNVNPLEIHENSEEKPPKETKPNDGKLLNKKVKRDALRVKRKPNEIQTVSQVCPVLTREPAKESLRRALEDLGISEPSYIQRYTFGKCLEELGSQIVNQHFKDAVLDAETKNWKKCGNCGFRTESRLVMGLHLEQKHKGRFKKWPFSSRMDYSMFTKV